MAVRKSFNGDGAVDYLGIGRNLLTQLLHSMKLNNLQVLSRSVQLDGGVVITVSSTFGQHDIRIEAPPGVLPDEIVDTDALIEQVAKVPLFGQLQDVVQVAGTVKLTLIKRVPPPPPPPPPPPTPPWSPPPPAGGGDGGGTGGWTIGHMDGGGGGDPGYTPTPSDSDEIDISTLDTIFITSSITLTIVTATYPQAPTAPAGGPTIFIGGQTSRGKDAFVWDDVNGYTPLDLGNSTQRKNGIVLGFSPNGQVIVGRLDLLQSNQFNPRAAKWQSRTSQAQVAGDATATSGLMQEAWQSDNSGGAVLGAGIASAGNTLSSWHFKWNGQNNNSAAIEAGTIMQMGLTNGVMRVSGLNYSISGGAWTNWGPNSKTLPAGARQAPSDAVAACCMYVGSTSNNGGGVISVPPATYTTTVLVFSG